MAHWTQRIRAELYCALGPYPAPFFLLWKALHPGADHHVHTKTQIVIEGYPRSSNSFADVAFRIAQLPEIVHQAHHIHTPAQIIRGIQQGLPCVVLIRPPEDAVVSTAIYDPANSLRHHLRAYIRFYRSLLPHQAGFVTAAFDQVTRDYGAVIDQVNERFGTRFTTFDHTDENVAEVMAVLKKEGRKSEGDHFESRAAMPIDARKTDQERLKQALDQAIYRPLLNEARTLYRTYEGFSHPRESEK